MTNKIDIIILNFAQQIFPIFEYVEIKRNQVSLVGKIYFKMEINHEV